MWWGGLGGGGGVRCWGHFARYFSLLARHLLGQLPEEIDHVLLAALGPRTQDVLRVGPAVPQVGHLSWVSASARSSTCKKGSDKRLRSVCFLRHDQTLGKRGRCEADTREESVVAVKLTHVALRSLAPTQTHPAWERWERSASPPPPPPPPSSSSSPPPPHSAPPLPPCPAAHSRAPRRWGPGWFRT